MEFKEYTIKDIAKKAGVAKSTVSRVLNSSGYVSPETKEKILKIIDECGYVPSAPARSLSKQESNAIGVILPQVYSAFFGEVLTGMLSAADEIDIPLIICNTEGDRDKEIRAIQTLVEQRVKGLILAIANDYPTNEDVVRLLALLYSLHFPVVLLDRKMATAPLGNFDGVYYDNFKGAYLATEAMIKAGSKKLGIITGPSTLSLHVERFNGFMKALEDYNIPVEERYIFKGNSEMMAAYQLTKRFIRQNNIPDGIFTMNNRSSLGCIKALWEEKLMIGEDICIVGFDRVRELEFFDIPFSYVDHDPVDMGRRAIHLLNERIKNPSDPKREELIEAKLVLKGSELSYIR